MNYYHAKTLRGKSFQEVIDIAKAELKTEGFGVVSEIDISETLKNKINVDFKKYRILGACNPHFAYKALLAEDKIGVFLPCNVVVEEHEPGVVEVSAVDPVASMISVGNAALEPLASEIQQKLINFIGRL
ncbi:DUF302 domain-containing protein [bacterium]|nr:DUF302 domain-containing protein [bacterium]